MAETDEAAKRAMLRMLASREFPFPDPCGEAVWREVQRIAQQHLLAPLLHRRINEEPGSVFAVPDWFRVMAAREYRDAALRALALEGTLHRIDGLLRGAGIGYAALKGPRLAWRCYPHPALRPMRDLDILVRPSDAQAAHALLLENGCRRYPDENRPDSLTLAEEKHLAPIEDEASGIRIEVHTRLFEVGIARDPDTQMMRTDALLDRAVSLAFPNMTVAVLPVEEALLHCIVHAVHDSKFSNGPIAVSDIFYMLAAETPDWPRFWELAGQGGWTGGCVLMLRLAEWMHGPQQVDWCGHDSQRPSDAVLEQAAFSMMMDKQRKRDIEIRVGRGKRTAGEGGGYLSLIFPKKHQLQDFTGTTSNTAFVWLAYPAWLASRAGRFLRSTLDRRSRSEVDTVRTVMDWVEAEDG